MKNETKAEKIQNLLSKLVLMRRKCAKSKSVKAKLELHRLQAECAKELEYLVEARTRRYRGFANYEDLCQDGRIALFLALQSYEPEKGDFFWWANKYIKTKISREANRHSTIKIPLKQTRLVQPYKVSQLPIIVDNAPSAVDNMANEEKSNLIKYAINKLPPDQRKVIELHYEMSERDTNSIVKICSTMKISRMNCIKLLDEAKNTLKQNLVEMGV